MIRHLKHITLLFILCSFQSFSQKIYIEHEISEEEIYANNEFQINYHLVVEASSFSFSHTGLKIKDPDFDGLEVVRKGELPSEFGFSRKIKIASYGYILKAKTEGNYKISHFEISFNGQKFRSNEINLKVLKGKNRKGIRGNYSLELSVNKTSCYFGEKIYASITYYSASNIVGFSFPSPPKFDGFISELYKKEEDAEIKTINGRKYIVQKVATYELKPVKTGDLKIKTIEGNLFFNRYRSTGLKSNSLTINVASPPTNNQPENYTGLVGKFSIDQNIDKTEVNVNDAITFKITLKGNGNFEAFEAPKLDLPGAIEQMEPTQKQNNSSKTYEYVLIPRKGGQFDIPEISIPYFDPNSKTYKSLTSSAIKIKVNGGANGEQILSNSNSIKKDVNIENKDIRYLDLNKDLKTKTKESFVSSSLHYTLISIGSLGFFTLLILFRPRNLSEQENKLERSKKAGKKALKVLNKAKELIGDNAKFYEEVDNAFSHYLIDKLSIPHSDFSIENLKSVLNNKNISEEVSNTAVYILNNCKMSRFSPISIETEEMFDKCLSCIEQLEKEIK